MHKGAGNVAWAPLDRLPRTQITSWQFRNGRNDRIATQRYSSRLGHCVIWTKWRRLVVGVLESNDDGTAAG